MPTEPVGFPQMSSGLQGGLQLVRDPTTGHILLIHSAGNETLRKRDSEHILTKQNQAARNGE